VWTFLLFHTKIEINKLETDDLTLVTSYYRIKSKKHKTKDYLDWINNIVKINKPFVFFTDKKFMPHLKRIRPKKFHNKTVFNTVELVDFYSYKNFRKEFINSWKIDFEKSYHSIPLYLVWAEKCNFLKKAIRENYFNSTCFYWIDAGYFREKNESYKYIENWPSTKKCHEEQRVLLGKVRNFSDFEIKKIVNFNYDYHIFLQKNINVAAGLFGGQSKNILKFIDLYYDSIKLFIKKKIFIGKEQNIYTYIAFSYPELVRLIYCKTYFSLKEYLS